MYVQCLCSKFQFSCFIIIIYFFQIQVKLVNAGITDLIADSQVTLSNAVGPYSATRASDVKTNNDNFIYLRTEETHTFRTPCEKFKCYGISASNYLLEPFLSTLYLNYGNTNGVTITIG